MAEYESPITIIQKEMQNQLTAQMEDSVIKTVWEYGIDVNKEELIKALQYDRNQYSKGYNDAKAEIVHCSECKHYDEDAISINIGWCSEFNGGRSADFFCADGESEVRRNKDEQRTVLDEAVRSNER